MGRSEQPYMYDAPSKRFSATSDSLYGFNPRAVTQASRSPPRKPPPKQEGPLLTFNRHPDSYLILPYGQPNVKPMSHRTGAKVKWTRWIQFGFRVLQLVGAIGMLICVICIKGMDDSVAWILRVPAAVDLLTSSYAIYHLMRPARGRTPASSASYNFFALFTDVGLIPFYVFTSMMAETNWQEEVGTDGRWRSFFSSDTATQKILLSTWLIGVTVAGLHLISVPIDLYLIVMFRKIARMPPDMNPLEDNLTSRRAKKHKHKNSSLTNIDVTEKRLGDLTGSTVSLSNPSRLSRAQDPLIPDARTMHFFHSRTDSADSFSPHNPQSAAASRNYLPDPDQIYQQPYSNNTSRADVHRRSDSKSPLKSEADLHFPLSPVATLPAYEPEITVSSPTASPTRTARSARRESLQSDNWFVHDGSEETYQPVPRYSFDESDYGDDEEEAQARAQLRPEPLRMNPPTPQGPSPGPESQNKHSRHDSQQATPAWSSRPSLEPHKRYTMPPMPFQSTIGSVSGHSDASTGIGRALTTASRRTDWTEMNYADEFGRALRRHGNGATNGNHHVYDDDSDNGDAADVQRTPSGSVKPRARYYGDLQAATQGVRQQRSAERVGYRIDRSPRVVSRTGVDYVDGGREADIGDMKLGGRREVSGKIAEEGRGGVGVGGWRGLVQRKVSGVA